MRFRQGLYVLQGEAELLTLFDKRDAFQILLRIAPVTRGRPRRLSQQTHTFVEPDGLNIHPGALREFSGSHIPIFNPIPWYSRN